MTQGRHATTVPPCCPSCHHMIRPPLTRGHRNFGTTGSLPYKQRGIYRHSHATHKLSHEHAKHLPYQMFKHACLVRRSRSLARRSSRLRPLSRNLRQSRNGGTNVKTNTCTETLPNIFQINPIKTRQNLEIDRKRITQKYLFIKKL